MEKKSLQVGPIREPTLFQMEKLEKAATPKAFKLIGSRHGRLVDAVFVHNSCEKVDMLAVRFSRFNVTYHQAVGRGRVAGTTKARNAMVSTCALPRWSVTFRIVIIKD